MPTSGNVVALSSTDIEDCGRLALIGGIKPLYSIENEVCKIEGLFTDRVDARIDRYNETYTARNTGKVDAAKYVETHGEIQVFNEEQDLHYNNAEVGMGSKPARRGEAHLKAYKRSHRQR